MTTEGSSRPLGFLPLLALGVNGIVGVGIFFAPAEVAAVVPGSSGLLVYGVTILALLPVAFAYAALGRRYPVDGGPFVWAKAAFGPRFAFMVGWVTYASSVFSVGAVVSGLATHSGPMLGVEGPWAIRVLAVGCVLILAIVASTGLRPSALVWSSVTVLKLVPLLVIVALGTLALSRPSAAVASPPITVISLNEAVLLLVFACQGFEIVPLLAGSVRHSERSVPWATVGALVFAGTLYTLLHWFSVRAVPDLGGSRAPLVAAAAAYGGDMAESLVAVGANVSALGIAFGMLNTTPRYLSALASEPALARLLEADVGAPVPLRALWGTTAIAAVLVAAASKLKVLFVLSSLAVLSQYAAVLASLLVLSYRGERGLRLRHAWAVPLSLVSITLVIRGAKKGEVLVAAGVVLVGLAILWFGRRSPGPSRAT